MEAEPYGQVAAGGDGGRRAQILVAVLAALLVATLAVGGVLGQKAWSNHEEEQGRDAAAGAAAKAAGLVLSYDWDCAAARQTLTPDFAAKFDQTTNLVGEQATKTKPTVKAEVREVSVTNSSADLVNVLLFVNQTPQHRHAVQAARRPGPRALNHGPRQRHLAGPGSSRPVSGTT